MEWRQWRGRANLLAYKSRQTERAGRTSGVIVELAYHTTATSATDSDSRPLAGPALLPINTVVDPCRANAAVCCRLVSADRAQSEKVEGNILEMK